VALPPTSVGSASAPGAVMLKTPPVVAPVTTCVPLAAAAGMEPKTSMPHDATMPLAMATTRRPVVCGVVSVIMRSCLRV
jgi:hypothetical protein